MTLAQAKHLYIQAGGPNDHTPEEWQRVHEEIEAIVAAKSDRAAGAIIRWWGCWDYVLTARRFTRRVRNAWQKEQC